MRPILCSTLPLFLALAGCNGGSPQVPVFPAEGKILFDGKPPAGAQVIFHPVGKAGSEVVRPTGQVDSTGKFTLTTYAANDGAPEGDYQVTVEWWIAKNDNPAVNQLPARYRQTQTSGLQAKITPGENQLPVFKLTR